MKLNKVNKNGSLSIILPKDVIKDLELKERQLIELIGFTRNTLLFSLNEQEKQPIVNVLNELQLTKESFNQMLKSIPKDFCW